MSWVQQMESKEKIIHHDISLRPWEVLGVDIFHLNNKYYLCIIDYHSKFLVIRRMEGLSTESLITAIKVIFAEYGISCRLMSDAGTNLVSEKFRSFCSRLNIEQAVSSVYQLVCSFHNICIKFIKCTIKNVQTPMMTFTWHYYKSVLYHWGKIYIVQQCCYLIIWYTV